MTRIVLTPEQAAVISSATEPVRIYFADGSIAGWLSSTIHLPPKMATFTPEEVASAERESESPGPWYTTQEVLDHLRSLDAGQ